MELTLKNFKSTLPKALLAHKLAVRECDETEKGNYVAYVDEKEESYDVNISIGSTGKITAHSCDCDDKNKNFCRHKAALLLHIAAGGKPKPVVKSRGKVSITDALLEDATHGQLTEWLRSLFKKNKDIELAFTHHFSKEGRQFTHEEVVKITQDAYKAVVGAKKNIDPTLLKKLVELLAEVHSPIVDNYLANTMEEHHFRNFHAMLQTTNDFRMRISSSSNRITKYVQDVLHRSVAVINDLFDEEAWNKATAFYLQQIPVGVGFFRVDYIHHIKNIVESARPERKTRLTRLIAAQLRRLGNQNMDHTDAYTKMFFGLVENTELFHEYYSVFNPIKFDNDYNTRLVQQLLDHGHTDIATRVCLDQIRGNYDEDFNLPYLLFLKDIYVSAKNEQDLVHTLIKLVPHTFDFDDFLFVSSRLDEEEGKKWRGNILSKARANARYIFSADMFSFLLLDYEQNHKKMIEYIKPFTSNIILLEYLESMAAANREKLLQALLYMPDDWDWAYTHDEQYRQLDEACLPALSELAIKVFTAGYIRRSLAARKSTWRVKLSRLMEYIQKQLEEDPAAL